jgi:hypothetical protein
MTTRVWTDRSRYITAERCKRRRWYEYHEGGLGIRSASMPLPLAVGGSVHVGLAALLSGATEEDAVAAALLDFAQYTPALELDSGEQAAFAPPAAGEDPELAGMVLASKGRFDAYLVNEQTALVEAMVRAYARRRLRPLLEQYEVLEVEREGSWTLHEEHGPEDFTKMGDGERIYPRSWQLMFMSRPDALLLDRASRQLYLLSFKTTGGWDVCKARDIEHDMQGLSEGIEVERRLAIWWAELQNLQASIDPIPAGIPDKLRMLHEGVDISDLTIKFLRSLPAPPRILGIRYEFLLKGPRKSA